MRTRQETSRAPAARKSREIGEEKLSCEDAGMESWGGCVDDIEVKLSSVVFIS